MRKFNPSALRALRATGGALGPGGEIHLLEAQYQDEFYRACYHLLGHTYLTEEWAGEKFGGRIDFHIKKVGWSIECLRDGERLDGHIARFRKGGRYYKWIKDGDIKEYIKEYILLDFRTYIPDKPKGMMIYNPAPSGSMNAHNQLNAPFLYHFVFSNDYASYQIHNARTEPVGDRIAFLN